MKMRYLGSRGSWLKSNDPVTTKGDNLKPGTIVEVSLDAHGSYSIDILSPRDGWSPSWVSDCFQSVENQGFEL